MDGPQNQRYYLNQWANSQGSKYMPVTNPFLNPFNWVKFFNSMKKNKKEKEIVALLTKLASIVIQHTPRVFFIEQSYSLTVKS